MPHRHSSVRRHPAYAQPSGKCRITGGTDDESQITDVGRYRVARWRVRRYGRANNIDSSRCSYRTGSRMYANNIDSSRCSYRTGSWIYVNGRKEPYVDRREEP